MPQFEQILTIKDKFNLLTSLVWVNLYMKASFTVSRPDTPFKHEFLWFTLDLVSDSKVERVYYFSASSILVEYGDITYKIVELSMNNRCVSRQVLLQMVDVHDTTSYMNFLGIEINKKR